MKQLVKQLGKNNRKERIAAYLTSALNIIVITVFFGILVELQKIYQEIQRVSKDEKMASFIVLLGCISVAIIAFTLWIIIIVHKTLFIQRRQFNINLKLAGISSGKLAKIYIWEALYMQVPIVPIALILAQLCYTIFARMNDFSTYYISITLMLVGALVHLVTIILCLMMTMRKLTKFDVVEELRGANTGDGIRNFNKKDIIKIVIGIAIILLAGVLGPWLQLDSNFLNILWILGSFLLFDMFLLGIQHTILFIAKSIKSKYLLLAQMNLLGYYKKTEPILTTLIIGVMLSVGLTGMFLTCRAISRDTVNQNLYFEDMIIYQRYNQKVVQSDIEKMIADADPDAKVSLSFGVRVFDQDGIENDITGIDGSYLEYGEKMRLVDGRDIAPMIEDDQWDGIFLPEYFISDQRIGEKYKLTLNGQELEFTIRGRFIANGSRGRYGFVSKSYLQKKLGMEGLVNMLCIHKGSDQLVEKLKSYDKAVQIDHITKKDIANNSYANAIKGTEIFEIGAFCIILCALLMLINYFVITGKNRNGDIARFRAIGIHPHEVKKIYRAELLSMIIQAMALGLALAYVVESVGVEMMQPYVDVPVHPIIPLWYVGIILGVIGIGSFSVMISTLKEGLGDKFIQYLRVTE